ncbi:hypothetical protein L7F22_017994 [Adiantum nelumboides]|nr:hypothetical protein [Adiantum nelumboides]
MYLDLGIYYLCRSTSREISTHVSRPRKLRLRREISTHVSRPVDILLVQEHKLSYAHTQRCGKLLPGGSHTFWEPTVGDHLSSGGVCISMGSRWLPRVIDHGTLVAGRAIWISLQCDASIVGILSIYAPTTAAERSWLWDQIVDVLPSVDSWIVGGDFNNVETFEDCGAAQPPTLPHIARCERDSWDRLLFALARVDVWHTPPFAHAHGLHERVRPWVSKKISEFLGEEEATLVDFIITSAKKHTTPTHLLELLENIFVEEAELFVVKFWRVVIYEISKVECGLT